jgi:hypothetical protein
MELPGSIAADAIVIKDGIGFKFQQAMQMLLTFVCSFVAAYIWGWQLAALMTAAVPVMAATMAWTMKIMSTATAQEAERYSVAGGYAAETLTNLRTVIAFGGQQARVALYKDGVMKARESGLKRAPVTSLGNAVPMASMFGMFGEPRPLFCRRALPLQLTNSASIVASRPLPDSSGRVVRLDSCDGRDIPQYVLRRAVDRWRRPARVFPNVHWRHHARSRRRQFCRGRRCVGSRKACHDDHRSGAGDRQLLGRRTKAWGG